MTALEMVLTSLSSRVLLMHMASDCWTFSLTLGPLSHLGGTQCWSLDWKSVQYSHPVQANPRSWLKVVADGCAVWGPSDTQYNASDSRAWIMLLSINEVIQYLLTLRMQPGDMCSVAIGCKLFQLALQCDSISCKLSILLHRRRKASCC